MHRALVLLALTACTTHNRVSAGATLGTSNTTGGGELTGEAAIGDDGKMIVIGATARGGHGLDGAAIRIGGEIESAPRPWGGRVTGTLGPAVFDSDGDLGVRFEMRGSVAIVRGFDRTEITTGLESTADHTRTVGLELFVTSIGISENEILIGAGLTFGSHTVDHPRSIAAMRRAKRAKLLAAARSPK